MLLKFIAGLTKPDRRVGMGAFGLIALAAVLLDQASKWAALFWLTTWIPASAPLPLSAVVNLRAEHPALTEVLTPGLDRPLSLTPRMLETLRAEQALMRIGHTDYVIVPHQVTIIPGFLNLWFRTNTGAAWSALSGQTDLLALVSVVISVLVLLWAWRLKPAERGLRIFFGLILGGAIGNLIDRVHWHCVIDFIDFYVTWGGTEHHYPTFNIADSAICVGIFLLVLASFRPITAAQPATDAPPAAPDQAVTAKKPSNSQ